MTMMHSFRKETQYFLLILAIIAVSLAFPSTAYAQRKSISAQEMGLLTFYKLSGLKPDFGAWIKDNPLYKETSKTNKGLAEMFWEEEVLRLQWGLGVIEPDKNFMHIQTEAIGTLIHSKGKDYLGITFLGKRGKGEPYFPYSIGSVWVAVIMKDIKKYMLVDLDTETLAKIKQHLPANITKAKLDLKITYRGISAETQPMKLDGVNQHIMLGEIASWKIFLPQPDNTKPVLIWEHIEPWYRTEEEDELIKMLNGED